MITCLLTIWASYSEGTEPYLPEKYLDSTPKLLIYGNLTKQHAVDERKLLKL